MACYDFGTPCIVEECPKCGRKNRLYMFEVFLKYAVECGHCEYRGPWRVHPMDALRQWEVVYDFDD